MLPTKTAEFERGTRRRLDDDAVLADRAGLDAVAEDERRDACEVARQVQFSDG